MAGLINEQELMNTLREMEQRGASDLLITVGRPPVLRIDGLLRDIPGLARLTPGQTRAWANSMLERAGIDEKDFRIGDFDFSISCPEVGRFRVNVYRQRGSYALAIRRVYSKLPDPHELGIPQTILDLTAMPKGLILITGPAGCGKTTTLCTLIDKVNHERDSHILTLEDPIEYLHRHNRCVIDQREIGADAHSYARALRAALRQSPDIILIGEMRDLETIGIALTAAETGTLVLSTLHTVGAAKSIDRIIDIFPPNQQQQIRMQLSTVLMAVVSQQLIPGVQGGLFPAFEILLVNSAVRNMIRENKTPQIDSVIQTNAASGMITMDKSLADLVRAGTISVEEAQSRVLNIDLFRRQL